MKRIWMMAITLFAFYTPTNTFYILFGTILNQWCISNQRNILQNIEWLKIGMSRLLTSSLKTTLMTLGGKCKFTLATLTYGSMVKIEFSKESKRLIKWRVLIIIKWIILEIILEKKEKMHKEIKRMSPNMKLMSILVTKIVIINLIQKIQAGELNWQ